MPRAVNISVLHAARNVVLDWSRCGPIVGHIACSLLLTAGLIAAASHVAVAAMGQSTVQVQVGKVYYQLPRWCVGGKLYGFNSDYAHGNYPLPGNETRWQETTPDGKNYIACLKEMKLGFIGASMTWQGKPPNKGTPNGNYDDWRAAANAVVQSGGGIMIEYMAGVDTMPFGTTSSETSATNINTGDWSPQNCVDWADYMASVNGRDKIILFEFYNEPATMNNLQLGANGGSYWYSSVNFPSNYDQKCADWATNHQQDYYKAVKAKYPNATICGASYAAPASSYMVGEMQRYLQGYAGARVTPANPNTKYEDALSLHCYGYATDTVTSPTPGAPSGQIQATFNSIFYPTFKDPGNVSGYKAGVDRWIATARALPGGRTNGLVDTEWWAYSPKVLPDTYYPTGGIEGSHQAVADVLGLIVHCQNADRWLFKAIEYAGINVGYGVGNPDAQRRPTEFNTVDAVLCTYSHNYNGDYQTHIYRSGRYFAIKDICARFANNYPNLVRSSVQGPASPAGPRHNSPGTQIQTCAGLNKTKTALAVCVANIGDSTQTVKVGFGQRARGPASGVKIPTYLDLEVPLTKLAPPFTDGTQEAVTVTLEGYTAALIEIPL